MAVRVRRPHFLRFEKGIPRYVRAATDTVDRSYIVKGRVTTYLGVIGIRASCVVGVWACV